MSDGDKILERAVEILGALVAFDTTSSLSPDIARSNLALIRYVREFLRAIGLESEIVQNPKSSGKSCLWATIGPDAKEGGIVLAGHTDVVPVQRERWESDPFTLTERDGKLYGRGSCDMKAFIACAMAFLESLAQRRMIDSLKIPLHLALTYDEEITMEGAERLTEWLRGRDVRPAWVWIGEPTGMCVVDAHKGVAEYRATIIGKACHAGLPHLGLSAIACACDLTRAVAEQERRKMEAPFENSRFLPPYTTFNVGRIQGGQASNIVAGSCKVAWQIRVHPGDETAQIQRQRIEAEVNGKWSELFGKFPGTKMETSVVCDIPPLEPSPDNPATKALWEMLGGEPQAVSFATEGGIFQKIGAPMKTPVVICGPGDIAVAHTDHEHVTREQLALCLNAMDRALGPSFPRTGF